MAIRYSPTGFGLRLFPRFAGETGLLDVLT